MKTSIQFTSFMLIFGIGIAAVFGQSLQFPKGGHQGRVPRDQPMPRIAPQSNSCEKGRPLQLITFRGSDTIPVLGKLKNLLSQNGFTVEKASTQEVLFQKTFQGGDKIKESVLVWLERDFNNPATHLKMFFEENKYVKVFGRSEYLRFQDGTYNYQNKTDFDALKNKIRQIFSSQ